MTEDRNQQKPRAGIGGQPQQQQGSGAKQQGMGSQKGPGQQQAFTTQQDQRQAGGMNSPQQQPGMGAQPQALARQIRPQMTVVDSQGKHVGTVDSCEGNRIKLTKGDSTSGQHSYLDTSQIASVDGGQIRLSGGAQFLS